MTHYDAAERRRLLTNREKVEALMTDRRWHSSVELMSVGGMRAVGRLHELKEHGWTYDKRKKSAGVFEYRLRRASVIDAAQVELPLP